MRLLRRTSVTRNGGSPRVDRSADRVLVTGPSKNRKCCQPVRRYICTSSRLPSRLFAAAGGDARFSVDVHQSSPAAYYEGSATVAESEPEPQLAKVESEEEPWAYRRRTAIALLSFLGPALTIPIADPLMSLVDTVIVGRFADTAQLAGLGPAALVFAFVNYIWTSQGVTTTSLVAKALNRTDVPRQERLTAASGILSSSFSLALGAGAAVCVALCAFAPQLIAVTGAGPELIGPAVEYLTVRALATPAVYGVIVIQAGLMAQRNSAWPSLVIFASASVNVVLDLLLIVNYGMGAVGAAWATLASQYFGLALLLFIVQAFGDVKLRLTIPQRADLQSFQSSTGSLAFIYVCKNMCYLGIQRVATALPMLSVAAHQPVFSLWSFCSFCTSPLEQAALAFFPTAKGLMEKRELPRLIMSLGLLIGVVAGLLAFWFPAYSPAFFTPDERLHGLMQALAPQAFLSIFLAGLEVAATAILVAKQDYKFMYNAMLRTLGVTTAYMSLVWWQGWGLPAVWWGFVVFFASRALQNIPRMVSVVRQELEEEQAKLSTASEPSRGDRSLIAE